MCNTTTQIRRVDFSAASNPPQTDKIELPAFVAEHKSGANLAALVVVAAVFTTLFASGFLLVGLA